LGKCPILQTPLEQQFSMLRAAGLHLLRGGIQRFGTIGYPIALVACYVAAWPLPRLDSHQLAVDSFRTHHAVVRRLFAVLSNAQTRFTVRARKSG